ncbi:hypothetical protein NGM99_00205 [Mesorhizobium sp. RP14(2022)]|uniref:Propionyl-coenzyme A carboxylase alpha polypeptide n=1 Tax=Mesorhizobium liriopis TaxID=2953882 RepID=A0ABT1C222_9HYPH|nr:hypothetical protein [Mesorhizobium liriopis]MCO6048211.1 hypothetical protein [Mesorhizobium liriopis]
MLPCARSLSRNARKKEGCIHGPVITEPRWRRRRPEPLSGRNPSLPDASAAGRIHARQTLPRA